MYNKNKPYWTLLDLDDNNPEHELFNSVINEFTEISGWPIWYYVKLESDNLDHLYGEDTTTQFTSAYETKLVYEPTGEQDVLNSFGISSDDTIEFMQIPKSLFKEDVELLYLENYSIENELQPKVGDCIRTLWNNRLYEIADVGAEQKIFQGKKLVWEFIVKPYTHSEESESADDMFEDTPDEEFYPDENEEMFMDSTTEPLTAFGDDEYLNDESTLDELDDDSVDSNIYGF